MKNYFIFFLSTLLLTFSFSCKKSNSSSSSSGTDTLSAAAKLDLLRDSVYLYTKEVYLWHEVIPSYAVFNPRQYTGATELAAAQNEMAAIRALQPQDNKHSYSFVTTQAGSNAIQTGNAQDYGFFIKSASIDKALPYDSVYWYVEYVYKASPAGTAGVQRGWYISKINSTNIGIDNSSVALLNDVFFGSTTSASFTFTKPDGSTASLNLAKGSYTANSVLYTDVITSGASKAGYLVFNQFFGSGSQTELTNAFTDFAAKGINDLIVDLRYNHGGSTDTQNLLADLIAPSSANGKTMYTYVFNDSLVAGKFPLLKRKAGFSNVSFAASYNTINYQKSGSVTGLSRVFFIVSSETASASELLINNLRPYMDVKLVGDTTYGKPVGFFPISIFDYAIYPISFKTVNSVGSAEYYDGFVPDKLTADGVNRSWGDVDEPSLSAALRYIATGSFARVDNTSDQENQKLLSVQKQYQPFNANLYNNKFTGMFTAAPQH
ncbi:MAG: S41 family peptidase [Chitinophagaceae bacterium]